MLSRLQEYGFTHYTILIEPGDAGVIAMASCVRQNYDREPEYCHECEGLLWLQEDGSYLVGWEGEGEIVTPCPHAYYMVGDDLSKAIEKIEERLG